MYFLKKNIPLLCFFILTIVIALTMAVLDIQLYVNYLGAKEETEANVARIHDIIRKKPLPLQENVKALEKDIEQMQVKKIELQRMFGKIHRVALQKFARTIDKTEDALLKEFADYYKALPTEKQAGVTGERDKAILDEFLKRYYYPKDEDGNIVATPPKKLILNAENQAKKNKLDLALKEFEEYAKQFLYYDNNGFRFLLEALGLPHTELASDFKRQMTEVNEKILSANLIPGLNADDYHHESRNDNAKKGNNDIAYYTFDLQNLPLQRETFLACRQLQIKLDLYSRMKQARLARIQKMETMTSLEGKKIENDTCLVYTYNIEVDGSMDSIRNFLNHLNTAYKDYIVYNVREVQLSRPEPEDISKFAERTENTDSRDKEGKISEAYGKTVVGKDSNVRCTLLIDYIMYVEDLLQRQVPEQK